MHYIDNLLWFCGCSFLVLLAMLAILWTKADPTVPGRERVIRASQRLLFLFGLCLGSLKLKTYGRALAFNAVLLPFETSRGTQGMMPDAGVLIAFSNAVVKAGSDDRHFTFCIAQGDIPCGILLNDQVDANEAGVIQKNIALFGVWPETLPAVAAGAIAAYAFVTFDLTTPGRVKAIPTAAGSGTFIVIGRARFAVVNAGDPVSIIHCVPHPITY